MADTIRTEADLKDNLFKDNQAEGTITAQYMRDLISSTRFLQPIGWEFIFDNIYSQGSPLTLVDSVPQKLTITSNPSEELRYPTNWPNIWNQSEQKLDITGFLNGFGILRLSLIGVFAGGTAPHIDLFIDVGSDPIAPAGGGTDSNIIYGDSPNFAKAQNDPQAFNFIIPLFGGLDFVTNGGQIIIQSHLANIDIYQITLTSAAMLIPNPAGEG